MPSLSPQYSEGATCRLIGTDYQRCYGADIRLLRRKKQDSTYVSIQAPGRFEISLRRHVPVTTATWHLGQTGQRKPPALTNPDHQKDKRVLRRI